MDSYAVLGGAASDRHDKTTGARAIGQPRSLHDAIVSAEAFGKRLDETANTVSAIADRAERLATALGGSYPTEAAAGSSEARNRDAGGPRSSVDAINGSIGTLYERSEAFDPPLTRLHRALDVIERAIG